MKTENKGKVNTHDQADLPSKSPFSNIGPGDVVSKLKKKKVGSLRARGSTAKEGEEANLGKVSGAIKNFVNR